MKKIDATKYPVLAEILAPVQAGGGGKTPLRCDGEKGCQDPVTHIDKRGFVYCEKHGSRRLASEPGRKLTPAEVKKLQSGEPIKY